MKNSWLVSLSLLILLAGCRSYTHRLAPVEANAERFTPAFLDAETFEHSFRARIEAYGHAMGGIFVIKKIRDNHYRMALLNEFGGTLLGFELSDGELKLHQAIEPLRRDAVLDMLKRDFMLLLHDNARVTGQYNDGDAWVYETSVDGKPAYHYLRKTDHALLKTVRAKGRRARTAITYAYRDPAFPDITLSHRGGKLNIFLFLLPEDRSESDAPLQ